MKKMVLFLVFSLLVFGSLSMAQEPDKQIEKSITKLEQAQDLLEERNKKEASSILAEVRSEITQARFQLLATEPKKTLVGSQWAVEFPEELSVETGSTYSDEYDIEVGDVIVKNQADEERGADLDAYLLDPKGIQRSLVLSPDFFVLSGSSKYFSWRGTIEKSKFIPGTYTLLFKSNFESKPEKLRFTIDLSKKRF